MGYTNYFRYIIFVGFSQITEDAPADLVANTAQPVLANIIDSIGPLTTASGEKNWARFYVEVPKGEIRRVKVRSCLGGGGMQLLFF